MRLEVADDLAELLHDDGCQPFGDFVQQQELGAGSQNAGHGEHLLLAARQACAGAVGAFLEVGKHGVDLFERHAVFAHLGQQREVLLGGQ